MKNEDAWMLNGAERIFSLIRTTDNEHLLIIEDRSKLIFLEESYSLRKPIPFKPSWVGDYISSFKSKSQPNPALVAQGVVASILFPVVGTAVAVSENAFSRDGWSARKRQLEALNKIYRVASSTRLAALIWETGYRNSRSKRSIHYDFDSQRLEFQPGSLRELLIYFVSKSDECISNKRELSDFESMLATQPKARKSASTKKSQGVGERFEASLSQEQELVKAYQEAKIEEPFRARLDTSDPMFQLELRLARKWDQGGRK